MEQLPNVLSHHNSTSVENQQLQRALRMKIQYFSPDGHTYPRTAPEGVETKGWPVRQSIWPPQETSLGAGVTYVASGLLYS